MHALLWIRLGYDLSALCHEQLFALEQILLGGVHGCTSLVCYSVHVCGPCRLASS